LGSNDTPPILDLFLGVPALKYTWAGLREQTVVSVFSAQLIQSRSAAVSPVAYEVLALASWFRRFAGMMRAFAPPTSHRLAVFFSAEKDARFLVGH
jgi:hypothetical protein